MKVARCPFYRDAWLTCIRYTRDCFAFVVLVRQAVKTGGPNEESNKLLADTIKEAKLNNVPKDNVTRAIKKASEGSQEDFKEMVYEVRVCSVVSSETSCMRMYESSEKAFEVSQEDFEEMVYEGRWCRSLPLDPFSCECLEYVKVDPIVCVFALPLSDPCVFRFYVMPSVFCRECHPYLALHCSRVRM